MDQVRARSGQVGEVEASEAEQRTGETVLALLRLFSKEATRTACEYATGQGRRVVGGADMRRALMYQARTFFEQGDAALYGRVADEEAEMRREEDEEDEEGEEESADDDAPDVSDAERAAYTATVRHVDAIAATWHLWEPTDPVHVLIKRAIDNTPVGDGSSSGDDDEGEGEDDGGEGDGEEECKENAASCEGGGGGRDGKADAAAEE